MGGRPKGKEGEKGARGLIQGALRLKMGKASKLRDSWGAGPSNVGGGRADSGSPGEWEEGSTSLDARPL